MQILLIMENNHSFEFCIIICQFRKKFYANVSLSVSLFLSLTICLCKLRSVSMKPVFHIFLNYIKIYAFIATNQVRFILFNWIRMRNPILIMILKGIFACAMCLCVSLCEKESHIVTFAEIRWLTAADWSTKIMGAKSAGWFGTMLAFFGWKRIQQPQNCTPPIFDSPTWG